jgi:hypothetical protein
VQIFVTEEKQHSAYAFGVLATYMVSTINCQLYRYAIRETTYWKSNLHTSKIGGISHLAFENSESINKI